MIKIRVPYLIFSEGIITPEKSLVLTCTALALKNGFFLNALIIDSNRNVFKVKNAKIINRETFPWWLKISFIWNPKFLVDLNLQPEHSKISLKQMKNKVLPDVRRWISSVGPGYGKEFKEKIMKASTTKEIIDLLHKQYYGEFLVANPKKDSWIGSLDGYGWPGILTIFFILLSLFAGIGIGSPKNAIEIVFVIGSPIFAAIFAFVALHKKEKTNN